MSHFAANLRFLRKNKRMSQAELGGEIGKSQNTIANWENALNEPSFEELIKLSDFFEVSPTLLLLGRLENANEVEDFNIKSTEEKLNLVIDHSTNKKRKKNLRYPSYDAPLSIAREGDDSLEWLLLQEVRRNSEKLETLRAAIEKLLNKSNEEKK
jgi:transcriptional regulator with XRE-family HTH domain